MRFSFLHRSERRGIIALILTLALIVSTFTYRHFQTPQGVSPVDSSTLPQNTIAAYKTKKPRYYAQPVAPRDSFPFDPNTADSTQLLRLGLTPSMVRGIYKFRSMGYTYSHPDDFARVPGMTRGLWAHLRPLIRIAPEFQPVELPARPKSTDNHVSPSPAPQRDTLQYPIKLTQGQQIELNTADTTALKKIPGIGSYYARQIIRYRQQLGGFVSLNQLEEVEGVPPTAADYLTVDASQVQRIKVNQATKNQLIQHPYIRVYRARAIWSYRHNHGPLPSADALLSLPDFSADDVTRLLPYLEFEE